MGGKSSSAAMDGSTTSIAAEWFDFVKHGWQIFFGSDGSGATIHWHAAAFNILYVGMKEWHITPPKHRGFSGMPAQQVKAKIGDEPFVLKCTQFPGDLIYIPDHVSLVFFLSMISISLCLLILYHHDPLIVGAYDD